MHRLRSAALLVLLCASTASGVPLGSVSGLPGATGITVDPSTGDLYVKSGIAGTVWWVPVGSDGTLGTATTVSSSLGSAVHIALDLAGNIYGIQPGGNPATLTLRRYATSLSLVQDTRLSLSGSSPSRRGSPDRSPSRLRVGSPTACSLT